MQRVLLIFRYIIVLIICHFESKSQKIEITTVEFDNMGRKNRPEFKKININDTILLNSNQNFFRIHFKSPFKGNEFAYRFTDFESNFISTKNNYAYYTNVEDGFHTFTVKDRLNTILQPAHLVIIIESPFWLQWWFAPIVFLFVLIVLSVIIYLIFLYRYSQQLKLLKVRNDIASDLHDDIGATLSSISFFGEMMRSKVLKNAPAEEVLPLLDRVINTSKETIETMRGVVWTINPNNDNAIDFFQKLQTFGKEMLASKSIDFKFETIGFENNKLPLDIQRNLFLFYKESINNIAKHAKANLVEVKIAFNEGKAMLFIQDNGIGFNPTDLHEGHGLKSLRKRADELQGNLEINSSLGQGTSIKLDFAID